MTTEPNRPDFIRCSALPEAFICPGSIRGADVLIDAVNGAADLGTAAHELMAQVVTGDLESTAGLPIDAVAKRAGVDRDDLGVMAYRGVQMWKELRGAFRGAVAEPHMTAGLTRLGLTLSGHLDLLALFPAQRLARLLDWKSGRIDRDYSNQVFGYAVIVLANEPEIDQVDMVIGWLREGEIERYTVTRADAEVWIERLRVEVVEWDGVYRPGGHCAHCARSHACPALVEMERRDLAIFGQPDMAAAALNGIASMEPARVVEIYRQTRLLAKLCESFHGLVKLRAIAAPLDSGDGKVLTVVDQNRREIDPLKAWEIMEAKLTPEELASCLKVRPSELDDLVAKKAGRGNGAAAKRALAEELQKADAVTVTVSRMLREIRK